MTLSLADIWANCSVEERRTIENGFGPVKPVKASGVIDTLRRRYEEGSSHIALWEGGRSWTYAELGERVLSLACHLQEATGETAPVVGVAISRSVELVVAAHAVALIGGSYCPINPNDPRRWVERILRDSGAQLLITASNFDAGDLRIQTVDASLMLEGASVATPRISDNNLSQIIFTSGSTGNPKGVACTHLGFSNRIQWMNDTYPLRPEDRVAFKTAFTFDVAGWEIFWPQYAGAQGVIVPEGAHASPEALISIFNQQQITVAHFVPSMLRMWLMANGARRCPSLRMVFASGEVLSPDLARAFLEQSNAELHNLYGPTEASIDVTHFRVTDADQPILIGTPIDNTRIYICDESGHVCPPGVTGEIHINGVGVANGYLETAGAENERFSIQPQSSWHTFRTGDLGRYCSDGQIAFLGRKDNQVKIRGQRVELDEISAVLCSHPSLTAACTRLHSTGAERKRLITYVTLLPDHGLGDPAGELIKYVSSQLPSRSIPSRIIVLSEFPVTSHGKIDYAQLPLPGNTRPNMSTEYLEPKTASQIAIGAIWEQVLGIEEVGIYDDFHELGGDSLNAVEISFLVAERLGIGHDDDLVADILLEGHCVAAAAEIVDESKSYAP